MQHYKQACKDIELLSSFTTFPLNQVSKAVVHGGPGSGGEHTDMGLYSDSSAICKQGRGNDCVHTCNLRLGFGNLSLPERGTASTAEEAGKEGWGELTAFPPSICHPLPLFLPAHLCLSFSLKLSFCEGSVSSMCPHTTCNSQSRSLVLRPSVYFKPAEGRRVSFIFLCVSSSLSAVRMQTRPYR